MPTSTGAIHQQAAVPVPATPEEFREADRADASSSEQATSKDEEERTEEPPTSPEPEHTPAGEIVGCNIDGGGDGGRGPVLSEEAPPSSSPGLPQEPPLEGAELSGPAAVTGTATIEDASPEAAIARERNSPGGSTGSANNATAATAARDAPAGDSGDEPPPPMSRLLCTGAAVRHPRLQDSGPVTGDMLEQQTLGHASTYRGREVLLADMIAFRTENGRSVDGGGGGGAVFADFVRWYRPECWQVRWSWGEHLLFLALFWRHFSKRLG